MYNPTTLSRTVTYDNFPSVTNTRTFLVGNAATTQKVANWKQKILSGSDATSDRDASEVTFSATRYSAKVAVKSNPLDWEAVSSNMGYFTDYSLNTPLEAELQQSAILKWYQEVGSDMNVYTTLGELAESIRMIKSPAMGLRKLVDAQYAKAWDRRTTYSKLSSYRKAASELWLEFAFGWRPLINEINGYYSLLNKDEGPLNKILHAVATAHQDTRDSSQTSSTGELYATIFKRQLEVQNRHSYRVSASYALKASWSAGGYDLGSTPADLVPAAWELMPWSFLIDYFSTVGKVLNAHITASKIGVTFASGTYRRESIYNQTITPVLDTSYPAMFGVYMNPGTAKLGVKVIKRRRLQLSVPQVTLDRQLSFGQGLNILALLGKRNADLSYKP